MTDIPEDPHERLQRRVREHTDEYLLVARIGDETAVSMSDSAWAAAIFDQIQPAIDEAVRQDKATTSADRRHGHHGKDANPPEGST